MFYLIIISYILFLTNSQYTYDDFYAIDINTVDDLPQTAVFSDSKDMG